MGLENRDYYRDGSYTASLAAWGVDFTPVVKYLIIVNVIVFLLQLFISKPGPLPVPPFEAAQRALAEAEAAKRRGEAEEDFPAEEQRQKREETARKMREQVEEAMSQMPGGRVSIVQEWLELDPKKTLLQGQLWRLLTCAFCHNRYAPWHILFNMLMLYWFGTRLERMYGSREFLLFYLAAAVAGSLAYAGLALYAGSNAPAIAASGAVMGVMMLYVIYYPFETFLLCWFIPVPLWALLGVYVLYDLHPVLLTLAGDQFYTGVAHAGHLGGLAFGYLYWRLGRRLEGVFGRKWRGTRPRRVKSAPLREPVILSYSGRDELAERVDEVLKKISEQGKESLTAEERDLLIEASAKYRQKK
jgi:membrane associated rhomboid family serine protease